ncbi:MAG: hypothetical protein ACLVAT_07780 [Lachnospiraceae bacterium]
MDIQCEDFVDILLNNGSFQSKKVLFIEIKQGYFMTGFETFDLWKAVVAKSFLYTGKYLVDLWKKKHEIIW